MWHVAYVLFSSLREALKVKTVKLTCLQLEVQFGNWLGPPCTGFLEFKQTIQQAPYPHQYEHHIPNGPACLQIFQVCWHSKLHTRLSRPEIEKFKI